MRTLTNYFKRTHNSQYNKRIFEVSKVWFLRMSFALILNIAFYSFVHAQFHLVSNSTLQQIQHIETIRVDADRGVFVRSTNEAYSYDGHELKTFQNEQQQNIEGIQVWVPWKALQNRMVVGTSSGLFIESSPMKGKSFQQLSETAIYDMDEDANGNLWLGTSRGLFRLDSQKQLKSIQVSPSIGIVDQVKVDMQGNLFFVQEQQLYTYNPNTNIYEKKNLKGTRLSKTKEGIWLSATDQQSTLYLIPNTLTNPIPFRQFKGVWAVQEFEHQLYITTLNQGIWRGNMPQSLQQWDKQQSCRAFYLDSTLTAWCFGNAPNEPTQLRYRFADDHLLQTFSLNGYVRDMAIGRNQDIWVATENALLQRKNDNLEVFKGVKLQFTSLPNLAIDTNDDLLFWDNSTGGVMQNISTQDERKLAWTHLIQEPVQALFHGRNGSRWILTDTYLYLLDSQTQIVQKISRTQGYLSSQIDPKRGKTDIKGHLWVSSEKGLLEIQTNGKVSQATSPNGNPCAQSTSDSFTFWTDANFQLWGASKKGFFKLLEKQGKATCETLNIEGLTNIHPLNVLTDENGDWWMVGELNGFYRVYHISPKEGFSWAVCTAMDGRIKDPFIYTASDSAGNLWFANESNLYRLDLRALKQTQAAFKVKLLQAKALFRSLPFEKQGQGYAIDPSVLSYTNSSLSFWFSVPELANLSNNTLRVKMEPWENTSRSLNGETTLRYTDLKSGKYALNVRTANRWGLWSPEDVSVSFTIPIPWYQTIWFYIGLLLLGGTIIGTPLWVIQRQKRRHQLEQKEIAHQHQLEQKEIAYQHQLENQEHEFALQQAAFQAREEAMNESYSLLHNETATNLHIVSSKLRDLIGRFSDVAPEKVELEKSLELNTDILNHANNIMFANKSAQTFHDLIAYLKRTIRLYDNAEGLQRTKIFFEDSSEGFDTSQLTFDFKYQICSAFTEILGNAIKYAQAHFITVTVWIQQREIPVLHLKIVDDGKGFDLEAIGPNGGINKTKKKLQEKIQAELICHSEKYEGTTIEIVVPFP